MKITVGTLAVLASALVLGTRSAAAQAPRLQTVAVAPGVTQHPGPQQAGSSRTVTLAVVPTRLQCPMPVSVPNLSSVVRMPVARVDTTGLAIRVVPPGCVNPLFPQARSTVRSVKAQQP